MRDELANDISDAHGGRPVVFGVQWIPTGFAFLYSAWVHEDAMSVLASNFSSLSHNDLMRSGLQTKVVHKPISAELVLPVEKLRQTKVYEGFLAKTGGLLPDVFLMSHLSSILVTVLGSARRPDQPRWGERELEIMKRLSPHLVFALNSHRL